MKISVVSQCLPQKSLWVSIGGFLTKTLLTTLLIIGCRQPADRLAGGHTHTMVDDLEHSVTFKADSIRLVSMAPSITEIIFAIGAGDHVVGRTDYCNYPPEVASIPSIGGMINPNIEAIVSKRPDLVIMTADGNPKQVSDKLNEIGIPVFVQEATTLPGVLRSIHQLAMITGEKSAADSLVLAMLADISGLQTPFPRPSVFIVLNSNPVISAGPATFLHQVVTFAGGQNIVPDGPARYPTINKEFLIEADPDWVIIPANQDSFGFMQTGDFHNEFQTLSAVKNKKILAIPADAALRPGPRLFSTIHELNRWITR